MLCLPCEHLFVSSLASNVVNGPSLTASCRGVCVCFVCVGEAGLRWRLRMPELSLQPENNRPAFCLESATAMTNTLELQRQRLPDGATMGPVCKRLCVSLHCLEWGRLAQTHTDQTRPFPGFHTRTWEQTGFSHWTVQKVSLRTPPLFPVWASHCVSNWLPDPRCSEGTPVKTWGHAVFLKRPLLGGPHPSNYGLFASHQQPFWLQVRSTNSTT